MTDYFFVSYCRAMTNTEKEPTPTIRGYMGRRRLSVGRLAAATGQMSEAKLQRRLSDPDKFQMGELALLATALDVDPGDMIAAWIEEVRQARR